MRKARAEGRIYLAVPYTCQEFKTLRVRRRIENERFRLVTEVSVILVEMGVAHFSPITQSHVQKKIADDMGITFVSDFEFWRRFDLAMLQGCTEMYVLKLPGWKNSVGVMAEIKRAQRLKKPVSYITYDEANQVITIDKE